MRHCAVVSAQPACRERLKSSVCCSCSAQEYVAEAQAQKNELAEKLALVDAKIQQTEALKA